jgi:hypothetical protein
VIDQDDGDAIAGAESLNMKDCFALVATESSGDIALCWYLSERQDARVWYSASLVEFFSEAEEVGSVRAERWLAHEGAATGDSDELSGALEFIECSAYCGSADAEARLDLPFCAEEIARSCRSLVDLGPEAEKQLVVEGDRGGLIEQRR